jgi:hypothetical protein
MRISKFIFLIALLFISNVIKAQEKQADDSQNCPITQSNLLLDRKPFANAPAILLRVYNEDYEYAVFQLGKRKNKIYLYFKIFTDNVCVKQKQPLELYFTDGEMYILKNKFAVNCDGTAVVELRNKDFQALKTHNIKAIKFFTLKKDYEFSPNDTDNKNIKEYLDCLKDFEIKK